ncbi:MAG: beta-galactosidase, partial [Anaerolineae bacterium]|nr:beta-galactosidase [Anaerolineae bacterium]
MRRRFAQHLVRMVTDLTGVWDFAFLGDVDPVTVDVATIPFQDRMAVPGCFDATPAYAGLRGLAAYRTHVVLYDDGPHRLLLDGVHHWCRVIVNGTALADHVGGFTQFYVDIPQPGYELEIVILVDNRFDYERCPLHLDYFDWYHYGGIARAVELHRLGDLWIDAVRVITADIGLDMTGPRVRVEVDYGCLATVGSTDIGIAVDGQVLLTETVNADGPTGRFVCELALPDAALWSPDAPNLHMLDVRMGQDDMRTRFGIRQIAVAQQQIVINGKPIRLLGFNRHEIHPEFGHGLPDSLLIADLQLLRDMGCNFVRGSHYPQDVRFLDLCDEYGICVWSESIGWQQTAAHLTDPRYIAAQMTNIDEMVAAAFNHPSVIMWGIQNESHSEDPACRPAYEQFLARLRAHDPARPVTFASNHPFDDVCLDLADIISINTYPGWYDGELEQIPVRLDQIAAHLDAEGHSAKPLIISEI